MLEQVELTNYRNLSVAKTLARCNLIVEPNSTGKSNFLESIYFSNFAHTFRPITDLSELIGNQGPFARITLQWSDMPDLKVIISQSPRLERKFELSGKRKKLSEIISRHNILLFAPTTIDLVAGEPAVRRTDLDDYLSIFNPEYFAAWSSYQLVLKNRNAVLKMLNDGRSAAAELDYFTSQLIALAGKVYNFRQEFFAQIVPFISDIGSSLFSIPRGELDVNYVPNLQHLAGEDFVTALTEKFSLNRAKEIAVGKTLYGVHKDDYVFYLRGSDLRYRGSRGQQRLGGLTFKLAQIKLLSAHNQKPTLLLLDDLMSELDQKHRDTCADYLLASDYQFILSAAELGDVPQQLIQGCQRLELIPVDGF
jgi:DNA replication and repair protein RecF